LYALVGFDTDPSVLLLAEHLTALALLERDDALVVIDVGAHNLRRRRALEGVTKDALIAHVDTKTCRRLRCLQRYAARVRQPLSPPPWDTRGPAARFKLRSLPFPSDTLRGQR